MHAHGGTGSDGIATPFSAMVPASSVAAALVWRNYGELCKDLGLETEEPSFRREAEEKQRRELFQNSDLGSRGREAEKFEVSCSEVPS